VRARSQTPAAALPRAAPLPLGESQDCIEFRRLDRPGAEGLGVYVVILVHDDETPSERSALVHTELYGIAHEVDRQAELMLGVRMAVHLAVPDRVAVVARDLERVQTVGGLGYPALELSDDRSEIPMNPKCEWSTTHQDTVTRVSQTR